jgi:hypothetical protein
MQRSEGREQGAEGRGQRSVSREQGAGNREQPRAGVRGRLIRSNLKGDKILPKFAKWSIIIGVLVVSFVVMIPLLTDFFAEKAPPVEYVQIFPDTDVEAGRKVIVQSQNLSWNITSTYDTSRLHEIYINDPSVPLNKKPQEARNQYKTNAKGLLDSKIAEINRAQKGNENIRRIDEKAKAEGRKPNRNDFNEYIDKGEPVGPYSNQWC